MYTPGVGVWDLLVIEKSTRIRRPSISWSHMASYKEFITCFHEFRKYETSIFSMQFVICLVCAKGGFYSEGTDAFFISSNRRTLLFSWAWILNLRYFKWPKSCQIRAWVSSEGSNSKMKPYLSLQSHFRHLYDMIWVL